MLVGLVLVALVSCCQGAPSFGIDYAHDTFVKDGSPIRLMSGSIHYFRVHPDDWTDRLTKLKFAGFNTVQTYIEWSSHEPRPGTHDFSGMLNVTEFVRQAHALGLLVIIRPGPFIDAERDMGGLPSWLIEENKYIQLRTSDKMFMTYVKMWYDVLLPKLKPLMYSEGGPIIMMQVENEYGSYPSCDFYYTTELRDVLYQHMGPSMLLYSTDGGYAALLRCGKVPEVYATVDFGPAGTPVGFFSAQRLFSPHGPLMNSEYYPGWLDHWGAAHSRRSILPITKTLEDMLALNASVNLYMAHGGTSFGLKAGSNMGTNIDPKIEFQACPTSYDYDAPISEAGDLTPKYWAVRETIGKYHPLPNMTTPKNSTKEAYGRVKVFVERTLFDIASNMPSRDSAKPQSFEQLQYDNGLVMYETNITQDTTDPSLLSVSAISDRAYVYLGRRYMGTLDRQRNILEMPLTARKGQKLTLVVESQGRICFGPGIKDSKGLFGPVKLGSLVLYNWKQTPVQLKPGDGQYNINEHRSAPTSDMGAMTWYAGNFNVTEPHDTFMRLDGWSKGMAWVNGFMLGRYWPRAGPQVTLYVPHGLLRKGGNMLMLLELQRSPCVEDSNCGVSFVDTPQIDGPVPR